MAGYVEQGLIEDLFRHNSWANSRLLAACESLTDEHLDANVPGTFGSIRDTLLHIIGAEVSYVHRVTGELPGEPPRPDEFPPISRLKDDAKWTGEELLKLALRAKSDEIVTQTRQGKQMRYKLTSLLTQAINHSTEHRAQIATILTQQGIEPPDMSGWAFMEEMGILEVLGEDS